MTHRYVTPAELGAQLGIVNLDDPRLDLACHAATRLIDNALGYPADVDTPEGDDPPALDPLDPIIRSTALSVAVDVFKLPDATFGVLGMNETGAVRIARDVMARYWPQLATYTAPRGWGIA